MLYQLGQLNLSALSAPGLYTQVIPPQTRFINGVPTDGLGLVGIGSWGPVNSPQLVGSPNDQLMYLGQPQVRKYDLSTSIAVALQLNASNITYVRVTDGTDTAASAALVDTAGTPVTGATLTGFYTGTIGNTITAAITAGTKGSTFKLTINRPGFSSEVFDNIAGTGAAFWTNLVSAVNNGVSGVRGPSQMVIASVGTSTAAPNVTNSYTLSGGTDGTTTLTDSLLIGQDGNAATRKGIYCLRSTGVQVVSLPDHADNTAWSTISLLAQSEGFYPGVQGSAGQSYSTVSTSLNSSGADTPWLKVFVGDWVYWQDQANSQRRLLSPSLFWAALQSAQAPHISSLNKRIGNVVSTSRVASGQVYSNAELGAAASARLDYITNPSPGGNYYACATGRNASSDATRLGDNYTRMTNYLGLTLAAAFGFVIGQNQTTDLRTTVKSSIEAFLANLQRLGMIGNPNAPQSPAFTVQINAANNPDSQVALGYMTANVKVRYLSVVFYFVVNLEGGQSVSIDVKAAPAAQ